MTRCCLSSNSCSVGSGLFTIIWICCLRRSAKFNSKAAGTTALDAGTKASIAETVPTIEASSGIKEPEAVRLRRSGGLPRLRVVIELLSSSSREVLSTKAAFSATARLLPRPLPAAHPLSRPLPRPRRPGPGWGTGGLVGGSISAT